MMNLTSKVNDILNMDDILHDSIKSAIGLVCKRNADSVNYSIVISSPVFGTLFPNLKDDRTLQAYFDGYFLMEDDLENILAYIAINHAVEFYHPKSIKELAQLETKELKLNQILFICNRDTAIQ